MWTWGEMVDEYRRRLNFVAASFKEMGLECHRPLGAFYAFSSVGKFGLKSKGFAIKLLHEERVADIPGTAFGECGEGFLRCAYAPQPGQRQGSDGPTPAVHREAVKFGVLPLGGRAGRNYKRHGGDSRGPKPGLRTARHTKNRFDSVLKPGMIPEPKVDALASTFILNQTTTF